MKLLKPTSSLKMGFITDMSKAILKSFSIASLTWYKNLVSKYYTFSEKRFRLFDVRFVNVTGLSILNSKTSSMMSIECSSHTRSTFVTSRIVRGISYYDLSRRFTLGNLTCFDYRRSYEDNGFRLTSRTLKGVSRYAYFGLDLEHKARLTSSANAGTWTMRFIMKRVRGGDYSGARITTAINKHAFNLSHLDSDGLNKIDALRLVKSEYNMVRGGQFGGRYGHIVSNFAIDYISGIRLTKAGRI